MIVGAGAGEGTSGVSVRGGGRVRGNSEMTYDASGTSEVGSFWGILSYCKGDCGWETGPGLGGDRDRSRKLQEIQRGLDYYIG